MKLRKLAIAAALGLSLVASGCESTNAPIKKVASIDEAAVYQMDMFVKAEKDLDAWAEKTSKEMSEKAKGKSDEEKAEMFKLFQADLEKKTNETLNPLKEKARAAVANAAKNKGATVVLDKKIVVYGVPDITEEVTGILKAGGEITYPKDNEEEAKNAPIGYFDQNIVRSLKVFKEAEVELFQERNRLVEKMREEMKKAEDQGKKASPAETQAMQKSIEARLESLQQQKMAPLVKSVTDSVEQVAKEKGLSLVLDTQHVMYGGRNLTEDVVDTFLKNVGQAPGAGATPSSTATPAPTPGQ